MRSLPMLSCFQLRPDLALGKATLDQLVAGGKEGVHERTRQATRRVTGRGLEQRRGLGGDGLLLEHRADRAVFDRLFGEQVAGAHQDTDRGPTAREWSGEGGDHGGRSLIVHSTREEQLEFGGATAVVEISLDDTQLGFPQREARPRPYVTAAFGSFEDELPGSRIQELTQ